MEYSPDVLGSPYEQATLPLAADDEGEVVATLVRRRSLPEPVEGRSFPEPVEGPARSLLEPRSLPEPVEGRKAVLHVHGFADYFFQTPAADFWCARGYDFYALDLRKYGRSLLPHQTPNYVADLTTYYEELDLAWAEVSRGHDQVVLSAHSTGGLTVPLWLHDRGHRPAGLFLNAPWIDMHGDTFTRLLAMPAIHRLGSRQPMRQVPRKVTGSYARSLHRNHLGEWDFDLRWKPELSFPVYAGWIRAIRTGQARVARGLDVRAPVLMISSTRSGHPRTDDDPDLFCTDVVLDVDRMRRRAAMLGRHVTIAQVEGALHDVTLSREPARTRAFDELDRFLTAYVDR